MQSLSPTSRYQLALNEGSHQPDDVQREAVSRLDTIYQELQKNPLKSKSGGKAAFRRLLEKSATGSRAGARPVYVGRRRARKNLADGPVLPEPAGNVNSVCTSIALCCGCMKS
jgi:hypothetical protein